jgi:hypothetical protein
MPWLPEHFSAPVLAQFEAKQRRKVVDVPYFDGLVAGEIERWSTPSPRAARGRRRSLRRGMRPSVI